MRIEYRFLMLFLDTGDVLPISSAQSQDIYCHIYAWQIKLIELYALGLLDEEDFRMMRARKMAN